MKKYYLIVIPIACIFMISAKAFIDFFKNGEFRIPNRDDIIVAVITAVVVTVTITITTKPKPWKNLIQKK